MKKKFITIILISAALVSCQKSPKVKTLNISSTAKYVSPLSLLKDTAVLALLGIFIILRFYQLSAPD